MYGKKALLEQMPPIQGGGDMIESVSWDKATYQKPPLRFEVVPAALRVRIPPGATALSPAALAPGLTHKTLARLWSTAIGRS